MADSGKFKDQLSPAEANNYWAAYYIVIDALALCRNRIVDQEGSAIDGATRRALEEARMSLKAYQDQMQVIRNRFNDGQMKIQPPDSEMLRSLARVSTKIAGSAGAPARLPEIIGMIEETIDKFHGLEEG